VLSSGASTSVSKRRKLLLVSHLRAVLIDSNEKNCPIPQKSLVKFKKYGDRYRSDFATKAGHSAARYPDRRLRQGWAQARILIRLSLDSVSGYFRLFLSCRRPRVPTHDEPCDRPIIARRSALWGRLDGFLPVYAPGCRNIVANQAGLYFIWRRPFQEEPKPIGGPTIFAVL